MNLMLSPALGWAAGGAIAAIMAVMAVVEVVLFVRRRRGSTGGGAPDTDETVAACVRRTMLCLLVALMALTPSVTAATNSRAVNATDVVVAVDVTGSMAVSDAAYGSGETMTRLDATRRAVDELTSLYPDSSFAALRFGASGTLDVPLTPDTRAIGNWAATLAPEATDVSAGSSLDAPLDQLLLTLKDLREQHPDDAIVLYVITDGDETSQRSRRSFSSLRRYLDDAYAVGVGSEQGGNIPVIRGGVASDGPDGTDGADGEGSSDEWVTDPDTGQPGVSKMDMDNIKELADEMGGAALALGANTTLAGARSDAASDRWRVGESAKERTRTQPVVWPLAIAAAVLLAFEAGAWFAASRRLL